MTEENVQAIEPEKPTDWPAIAAMRAMGAMNWEHHDAGFEPVLIETICCDDRHAEFIRAYPDAPAEAGFNHVSARMEGETPRYADLTWAERAAVDVYRAVIVAGDAAVKLHAPQPEPPPAPPAPPVDIEDTILRGHGDMLAPVSYAKGPVIGYARTGPMPEPSHQGGPVDAAATDASFAVQTPEAEPAAETANETGPVNVAGTADDPQAATKRAKR